MNFLMEGMGSIKHNPFLVDELLDCSFNRGCSQCWSKSFVPPVGDGSVKDVSSVGFGRSDGELLGCVFGGVVVSPSSPSDNIIKDDQKAVGVRGVAELHRPKSEPEELISSSESEGHIASQATTQEGSNDKNADPKRLKRILANRQSAQRSRLRKLRYIAELERRISTLQAQVSVLSPRVAYLDHRRLLLNADNSALKQRIAALAHDRVFKDAHREALTSEIERLGRIIYQQNLEKMTDTATLLPPESSSTATMDATDR